MHQEILGESFGTHSILLVQGNFVLQKQFPNFSHLEEVVLIKVASILYIVTKTD